MRPFVVPVAAILRQPGASKPIAFVAPFDERGELAAPTMGAAEVPPGADVEVRAVATSFIGGVMVTGTVVAPWHAACRRCATDVAGIAEVAVTERFSPLAGPDDDDAYPLVDESIDLWPMVRDAVVLELPLATLCAPGCLGLCAVCGADRNEQPCRCRPEPDARWATLDALRVPDQA